MNQKSREEELEEVLLYILDIFQSDSFKGSEVNAWIHGHRWPEEESKRNSKMFDRAYALLGKERP